MDPYSVKSLNWHKSDSHVPSYTIILPNKNRTTFTSNPVQKLKIQQLSEKHWLMCIDYTSVHSLIIYWFWGNFSFIALNEAFYIVNEWYLCNFVILLNFYIFCKISHLCKAMIRWVLHHILDCCVCLYWIR